MIDSNYISRWLNRHLLQVEKPGRYVGGEYNQVVKHWDDVNVHIALVFPDIYDLGISNLGLAILYDTLNQRSDVLAERAYSPWIDMENLMRQNDIPLFTVESKQPLSTFDIIGITLPYETLYTNCLNILDLAHIPIKSCDRNDQQPLIIAGGHAVFNPEPMAEFLDAFVIGEGEEVIHDIVDLYKTCMADGSHRQIVLSKLSTIPGVYVPQFYKPMYQSDGTIQSIQIINQPAPQKITKRIVAKLPPPPVKLLVPSIDVVHNRVAIEIMRGCTRGCRFCHAGMVSRPVRERPIDEIIQSIQDALEQTGFEEIALLSLSSSDHTHILPLIEAINHKFSSKNLRISLPSLRIDTMSVDLMEMLRDARPGGFTLAPEAATDHMRNIINKPVSREKLLDTAYQIYQRGWPTLKLYFMIGHPAETLDDVREIAYLCKEVRLQGVKGLGKRAQLHAGVSTFVPKAHTPFQWVPCDSKERIEEKQHLLIQELKGPGLKLSWTDPEETLLEAALARGDRHLSEVIFTAWTKGAKFDAWQERKNYAIWQDAFAAHDLDPAFFSNRQRPLDEVFPWVHIDVGVKKEFLIEEYCLSIDGCLREDCRSKCHACGILNTYASLRRKTPGDHWKCPDLSISNPS